MSGHYIGGFMIALVDIGIGLMIIAIASLILGVGIQLIRGNDNIENKDGK